MKITGVKHKGLRRLLETDDPSGLPAPFAEKLRRMLSFLQDMESVEELRGIPVWRVHQLTGDRKGDWSLAVSRNWRLSFRVDRSGIEIVDLDFEDYH
jgi:proteic killer suppression protein